jgi:uncharacterized protein YbjT (DUF2867 family)
MRREVRLVDAKERFVTALAESSLSYTIVHPTGFFSDMRAFLDMAKRGRTFLIGDGGHRINPISGRDLAVACVEAADSGATEIEVGGPEVFTHEQIARLAAAITGRAEHITHLPPSLLRAAIGALRFTTPERVYGPMQFFLAIMTTDMIAPMRGADHPSDFFRHEHARAGTCLP